LGYQIVTVLMTLIDLAHISRSQHFWKSYMSKQSIVTIEHKWELRKSYMYMAHQMVLFPVNLE